MHLGMLNEELANSALDCYIVGGGFGPFRGVATTSCFNHPLFSPFCSDMFRPCELQVCLALVLTFCLASHTGPC